ncbi:hypothetical protein V1502_10390 [Bacillus sp. SCS-153A]|uniref:hypothetical protein n=1 Tax=Rossellomorea sedimentorum TaxID=3115294 RepID=UPI003905F3F3
MIKRFLIIIGLVIVFTPQQNIMAEPASKAEGLYVTTEDIVRDIITPIIDKKMLKEYGGQQYYDWNLQRIIGIKYNDNHSYDISVQVNIPVENANMKEDFVKVRVFPSCERGKIKIQRCTHGFKVEIVEFKHLSR